MTSCLQTIPRDRRVGDARKALAYSLSDSLRTGQDCGWSLISTITGGTLFVCCNIIFWRLYVRPNVFYRRRRPKKRNVEIDPALSVTRSSSRLSATAAGDVRGDVIDDVAILGDAWNFQECCVMGKLSAENVRHTSVESFSRCPISVNDCYVCEVFFSLEISQT